MTVKKISSTRTKPEGQFRKLGSYLQFINYDLSTICMLNRECWPLGWVVVVWNRWKFFAVKERFGANWSNQFLNRIQQLNKTYIILYVFIILLSDKISKNDRLNDIEKIRFDSGKVRKENNINLKKNFFYGQNNVCWVGCYNISNSNIINYWVVAR